jgi:hypothetical protein
MEEPDVPGVEFGGFHYPWQLVHNSYRAYKDHGVLLVTGGYLDQPPEWWNDIHTYEAMYNSYYAQNLEEKRRRDG